MAKQLVLLTLDNRVSGSNPAGGKIISECKHSLHRAFHVHRYD